MTDWAKVVLVLVSGLSRLLRWLDRQALISEGQRQQIAAALHLQATEMLHANAAAEARRRLNASVAGELPDDGFRRD